MVEGVKLTKRSPPASNTAQNKTDIASQSIEREKRLWRNFQLDPEEDREHQESDDQQDADVRLMPSKTRSLVPCEVEQDHGSDADSGSEEIEFGELLFEAEALVLRFDRHGR